MISQQIFPEIATINGTQALPQNIAPQNMRMFENHKTQHIRLAINSKINGFPLSAFKPLYAKDNDQLRL